MYRVFFAFCWITILTFVLSEKILEVTEFQVMSQYDTSWIDWKTLRLTKVGRNKFVVSGDLELTRNLGDDQKIDLKVFRKAQKNSAYSAPIYMLNKPMCNYIATDDLLYPTLLKFSNLPGKGVCPAAKGVYTINDLVLTADLIPKGSPNGMYSFMLRLFDGARDVAGIECELELSNG